MKYEATHYSKMDGSPAMMIHEDPLVLMNEDGVAWNADPADWSTEPVHTDEDGEMLRWVPPLEMSLEGKAYGGAYYHEAEYRLRLTMFDRHGHFEVHVETEDGVEVRHFTADEAAAMDIIMATEQERIFENCVGLMLEASWYVGDEHRGIHVSVRMHNLDQVAEWLRYMLGWKTWNVEERGREWEW